MKHLMLSLKGSTVLITGASSGIGSALALAFADCGAQTILSARRVAQLEEVAQRIIDRGGLVPTILPADLSVRGEALALARAAQEKHGQIDILINNAGIGASGLQLALGDGDRARQIFEINYWSPVALASALFDGSKASRFRAIVNVGSLISAAPLPLTGHYAASKSALSQTTHALNLELAGTGVKVLEVLPGPIETPMLDDLRNMNESTARALARMPCGTPDAIAKAVLESLARGKNELVFPRSLAFMRHVPTLIRSLTLKSTRSQSA